MAKGAAMKPKSTELWIALLLIILILAAYFLVGVIEGGVPRASGVFGHGLGIAGFLLMLLTETLYTLRKRRHDARWGRTSTWMRLHVITGIVGPFMVLLHTSWKFNGLAGLTLILTLIVMGSGFVGRYLYTAIPRRDDGAEMEAEAVRREITRLAREIERRRDSREMGRALHSFQRQHKKIVRQLASLATARRLLSVWHTVHVPLTTALFLAAFVHILAAIYYVNLGP
jgi:hypothetical protein